MAIALVGRKLGMTRVFTEAGDSIPVTVIQVPANRITQLKSEDSVDGYTAVQVTIGEKKASRVNKAATGHFAKAGVAAGDGLWESRVESDVAADLKVGGEIKVDYLQEGQFVDVAGTTIGKGFAGGVKRHGFQMQDATHGNSVSHRAPGSIGQNQTPGRVFKGKKMAGHMGSVRRTIQNLEVVRVDADRDLLLVKGSVPGPKGGHVFVKLAVKAS